MQTVERVTALHRVAIFAKVPGRTLAAVARHATESVVDAGTTFIVEGAVEHHLFVIVDGRVRVHCGDRTVREIDAGGTVGELAVLVPEARSASVTAMERTTLLRIDKPVLDELLVDMPSLALGVVEALVRLVRELTPGTAEA